MPPTIALMAWAVLLIALLALDPAKIKGTSLALWVPVIWMFILGSRLPSQWLGLNRLGTAAQALEEGNPVDRTISSLLILLAIVILMTRSFRWDGFLRRNGALIAFLAFALFSCIWSDFPFVALKRWFRDLGSYLVILLVLSDTRPLEAVRTVLRRLCFLLVPLSILLIKYFPALGRQYEVWSGHAMFVGAATSKNMLGAICLISGVYFVWDTVTRWPDRKDRQTKKVILVNVALLGMTFWLLDLASSATSKVCLIIGCMVILAVQSGWGKRHPTFLKVLIPSAFCAYIILAFGFGLNGEFASRVGRDPTLTDRTLIWNTVLSQHTNPIIGTGYESFWLGPRLPAIWAVVGNINEAHNGYLDIYLNLGAIGLLVLAAFLMASYRTICKRMTTFPALASLGMAIWTVLLFYDVTEVAFKTGLLWLTLLLGAIVIPGRTEELVFSVSAINNMDSRPPLLRHPLEVANPRR
jgi:exopolysaccharide production protein ExoQ